MRQDGRFAFLYNPVFRVITWVWFLVGDRIRRMICVALLGIPMTLLLSELVQNWFFWSIVGMPMMLGSMLFALLCFDAFGR